MKWTEKEDILLAKMYPTYKIDEIISTLNKTQSSIYNRAYKLNLTRQVYGNKDLINFFDV